jgi:hypothetical protein
VLGAAIAAGPAQAQWRQGQHANPNVVAETRAELLAGYALMVDTWGDRLTEAVLEAEAHMPARSQEGALSRPRMTLLDAAQTAWVVIQNVPEGFDDRPAYRAADQQFHASIAAMLEASTPAAEALDEAWKIVAALDRLERAAVAAARSAAR